MRGRLCLAAALASACTSFDDAYDACVAQGQCRDAPRLTIFPAAARFESAPLRATQHSFEVANDADRATGPLAVVLDGDGFALTYDTCSGEGLAAHHRCAVAVEFMLSTAATRRGALSLVESRTLLAQAQLEGAAVVGALARIYFRGAGRGTVQTDGVTCYGDCGVSIGDGGLRALSALAAPSSRFRGWAGACAGAGECLVAGERDRVVEAWFDPDSRYLALSSTGAGRLHVAPEGWRCGPQCMGFDAGTAVTVTALPAAGLTVAGWAGDCSGSGPQCTLSMDSDRAVHLDLAGPNLVFVTSSAHAPGALGGLDGGDAVCRALAVDAGYFGDFVAWLSTPAVAAPSRLAGSRGWVRPDGRPFADLLPSSRVLYPPVLDERGATRASGHFSDLVVTGTATDGGAVPSMHCEGFTSLIGEGAAGFSPSGTDEWTHATTVSCATFAHLYCLERGRQVTIADAPLPPGARQVFVTRAKYTGDLGGTGGADVKCNAEARDAGLSGSFVAWVSGSREARGDLTAPGEAWYRLDGARVATTALVTSSVAAPEEAAPNVTRDRGYLGAPELIWNAAAPQILPDGGTYGSCGNWFSSSSQWRGSAASPRSASEWQAAVRNRTEPCDQPRRLLCVER